MKKIFCLSLLIFWALTAAHVRSESPSAIRIGWSGPLSGNSAVVGIDSVPAIQLAFDRINKLGGIHSRPLELLVEDDGYITMNGVKAYHKLVHQDKASVIFASTYGAVFATAAEAIKDNVLVLDSLDCNEDLASLPENTLCLATQTESIARQFARDISKRNLDSVSIIVEESDGWMQLISRTTTQLLAQLNIVANEESTSPNATDYKQNLLRAKSRGVKALILLGNDQMGLALRQARSLGINAQVYGIGSFLSPGFQSLAGTHINGALVSSWKANETPAFQSFLTDFKAKVGREPVLQLAAVPAFDLANILVNCLLEVSDSVGKFSTQNLRSCIIGTKNYSGLSGTISFDNDGAVRSIYEQLYRIEQGRLVVYKPTLNNIRQ